MSRVLGTVHIGGHLHTVVDPDAPESVAAVEGSAAASLPSAGVSSPAPAEDTNHQRSL